MGGAVELNQRLREYLADYAEGRLSLLELYAWVVTQEVTVPVAPDGDWRDLIALLNFLVIGLNTGRRDESTIRAIMAARLVAPPRAGRSRAPNN